MSAALFLSLIFRGKWKMSNRFALNSLILAKALMALSGILGLTLSATAPSLTAQTLVTGELTGTVTDPGGASIPNAVVRITNDSSGETRTVAANNQGAYRVPLLRPGPYTVFASASGFSDARLRTNVELGQVSNLEIGLKVGAVSEVIEINDRAALLQSENANVSSTISLTQMQNLPAGGGDMMAYLVGTPGTITNNVGAYGSFSSFGLPATSNLFTLNGNDIMDPYFNTNNSGASNLTLGANEIQETAIVTNGYSGQYGRQAGAQVNFITKSGTNMFHGNASWQWNGSKLNANDFFNNASGTPRPHEVSNEWAGSFGGPIKKNKLFFFVDQEGLRYVLPSGVPIFLPTTDFSNYVLSNLNASNPAAVPIYTRALSLYAGASGAARATPVTAAIDPQLGCGDFAAAGFGTTRPCARRFQSSVNSLNTEWLLSERVDFNVTDKDRVYYRGSIDRGVQATATDAINPAFSANSSQPQWSAQAGYTRVISPNSINELLLSGSYYSATFGPPNLAAALSVFPTTFAFNDGLFSSMGGGATPNGPAVDALSNYPNGRNVSQWQIVDDYAYSHGKHELKVGMNFKRNDVGDYSYGPGTSGQVTFNSMTDFVNGALSNGSTYSQTFARIGGEHIGIYSLALYGQDQWKIRPNLSVTAAVQFAKNANPSCARNCYARLAGTFAEVDHSATQPYNSAIHLGLNNAFPNLDGLLVLPRVGVSYSVNNKTVIRGGAGLFADQLQGVLNSRFFLNAPNVASFTTTAGTIAPGAAGSAFANVAASNAALQQGFSNGATLAQLQASVPGFALPTFYTVADQFHIPRYLEWNLEIQRDFAKHLVLSLNYVGNHGWNEVNQNPFPNAWSAQGFGGLPTAAPDLRFGEVNELTSTGRSNYDGLTSSLKWRFASLLGTLSYTYAHTLDTCSNNCRLPFSISTVTSLRYQFNPAAQSYGNADYDVRHSLTANYVWSVPTHFKNTVLKRGLGGWSVGGIVLARSGFPYTVVNSSLRSTYTKNTSGVGTASIPADWTGTSAQPCAGPDASCLTKSQFLSTAQQKNFGNLERNAFRGPMYFDTDLNVNKNIVASERLKFIVGASFFNILNHANFDLPVNNIAAGNFGQIISTVNPFSSAYGSFTGAQVSGRVIVFNTKFEF